MNGNDILPYLDAILGFCRRRISDPNDAEDLASEIVCHILAGLQRYHIQSLMKKFFIFLKKSCQVFEKLFHYKNKKITPLPYQEHGDFLIY